MLEAAAVGPAREPMENHRKDLWAVESCLAREGPEGGEQGSVKGAR